MRKGGNKYKQPAHSRPEEVRSFFSFVITVHPDQADPNCKHSCITCRACVQLPLDVDGIDAIINTQMLTTPHDLLVHLEAFNHGRNPYIGKPKKEKGEIFSEFCTERFKAKFL